MPTPVPLDHIQKHSDSMANEGFRKPGPRFNKSMAHTAPGSTPNGANKTPGTGGLADSLVKGLGYKGPSVGQWPLPTPDVNSMAAHIPGFDGGMASGRQLGAIGVQGPRLGSYAGKSGPTAPGAGVQRERGGMVGSSGGGDPEIKPPRTPGKFGGKNPVPYK